MHHHLMKWVWMISWLISSLAAINVGLLPFGFNFFTTDFILLNVPQLIMPLHYLILVAGLITLALFAMSFTGYCGCDKCNGGSSCGCK